MHSIIGIAGTAKNTGKTTTLNALLEQSPIAPESAGITSIGYDGEDIDTITGLPKPRVIVRKGMIVSTSLRCLPDSGWSIVEQTSFTSALGQIVIAQCETTSPIVLAGPKTKNDLREIARMMTVHGCTDIIVDGALNRIAPMAIVDTIIFTTGAARTPDIALLTQEMSAIERIFLIPQYIGTHRGSTNSNMMIHSADDVDLMVRFAGTSDIVIPGLISYDALNLLEKKLPGSAITSIIVSNPVSLILSGSAEQTASVIDRIIAHGIKVYCSHSIRLAAATINPFYPEYHGVSYSTSYVDARALESSMKNVLATPVFDLHRTDATQVWDCIQKPE